MREKLGLGGGAPHVLCSLISHCLTSRLGSLFFYWGDVFFVYIYQLNNNC